jgi:uncharacterized protein
MICEQQRKQAIRRKDMHATNTPTIYYYFSYLKINMIKWVDNVWERCAQHVAREKCMFIFVACFVSFTAHSQEPVKFFYENGTVSSEGIMRNGKPDGYWKTYYPDGGLKSEGNRMNFQLDSTWKFYRSDSTLERIITYAQDLKNGPEIIFSKEGKPLEEMPFENNIRSGRAKYFYPSGELQREVTFANNKEEGKGTEYERDGRIITLLTYRNGFIYSQEKINRYNSENRKTGIWQELHTNGRVKEEGNWTNGLRNGIFKFYNKKGELEKVEKYENGTLAAGDDETAILDIRRELNDDGTVKSMGSYKEGKKHGVFREFDEKGNITAGFIFDENTKAGEGMMDTLGRKQGAWRWFYPDGTVRSQGSYKDGKREGSWTFFYPSGKTEQQGSYKEDLATGAWKWYYSNGTVHRDELYRKGREDGHAIEYDTLGNVVSEGDYVDGLRVGKWKLTVNDHSEEGEYADGERTGEWVWKYNDGTEAFRGEYQGGIPIGKHRYWYPTGQVKMRGPYEGGELNGRWEYFDENGILNLTIDYQAGMVVRINGQKLKLPASGSSD